MRTWLRSKISLLFIVCAALIAIPAIALADNVSNTLDTSVDAVAENMPLNQDGATGTTKLYIDPTNGDGKNGCNLTGGTSLIVALSSDNTSVATVSPSQVTFTSCLTSANGIPITVTPHNAGTANISASLVSENADGTFNLAPATFKVTVAPPPNTPPTVTVAGVTGGASYNKGSVPSATCNVTDAEDGNSSFAATLSPVTGPFASDGIGSQTASCSYTDHGPGTPFTASSSLSYSIVDPSGPVINKVVTPASPNGDNGWYKSGNVTVVWTVSDPDSPNSIVKTGCNDQNITSDQPATTYTCSATSAGGSAAEQSVTIKRDGTAPNVTLGAASGTSGTNGWYKSVVTQTFNASDALSGLAGPASFTNSSGANEEGQNVNIASGPVSDNAGNTAASASAGPFKIDLSDPVANCDSAPSGWSQNDVNIHCQASDTISGLANNADADFDLSTSVPNGTETDNATTDDRVVADAAGRSVTAGPVSGIKVDKKAPSFNCDSADGNWHGTNVSLDCTANDGGSGLTPTSDANFSLSTTVTAGNETNNASTGTKTLTDDVGNTVTAPAISGNKVDMKAPVLTNDGPTPTNPNGANNWYINAVTNKFTATDGGSGFGTNGDLTKSITNSSGTNEGSAVKIASGAVSDAVGNSRASIDSAAFKIDLTNPTNVTFSGGPAAGNEYFFGDTPAAPTCTADDAVSGFASCNVTGYSTAVGPHTMTATAKDNAGRTATATRSYTVKPYTLTGFYQPIDMNDTVNTVKNGSTVPVKFELFKGGTELTSTSAVTSTKSNAIDCSALSGDPEDAIETVATGGTSLRYDTTGGQFIYNWTTPKGANQVGKCYSLTMTAADSSTMTALFKLK
jgi:hypothetical protein